MKTQPPHTYSCGFNGTATVTQWMGGIEWNHTDEKMHVAKEVVEKHTSLLGQKYDVGEWCEEAQAYHATLKEGL